MKPAIIIALLLLISSPAWSAPANAPTEINLEQEIARLDDLIKRREIESDALPKAISELTSYNERYPKKADILSRLAKAYYFLGKFSSSEKKKLDLFRRGMEYSKEALSINPDHLEANFWYGINLGRYSSTRGGLQALNSIRQIVASMKKIISIDPKFKNAGAYLVLGRVYMEAPGRPFSIGNKKKALEYLQKAKEADSSYYETHLYLMELYEKEHKTDLAKAEAEWLMNTPFEKEWPISAKEARERAQELIKKYRNK